MSKLIQLFSNGSLVSKFFFHFFFQLRCESVKSFQSGSSRLSSKRESDASIADDVSNELDVPKEPISKSASESK